MPPSEESRNGARQISARSGQATVYEIAERAGVSIATVSRVINGTAGIRPNTRARVQEAIDALDFVPNGSAQGIARRATGVLGLVYRRRLVAGYGSPDFDERKKAELVANTRQTMIYYDALIRYVEQAAFDRGYALLLAGAREEEPLSQLLKMSGQCDGMIIADVSIEESGMAKLMRQVPVVGLANNNSGQHLTNIAINNAKAMAQLVDHMIDKHQAKRIAFIGGPLDNADAEARAEAVQEQAVRRGVELDELEAWRGDYSPQTAFDIVERQCAKGQTLPDVLMCANDGTAAGAIAALHDLGYHIPRDVAVTGFDDLEIAHLTSPPLTTMRQPLEELARLAVEELLLGISNEAKPQCSHSVSAEIVIRGSCGCGPKTGRTTRRLAKSSDK